MTLDARKYSPGMPAAQSADQYQASTSNTGWICLLPLIFSYFQVVRILSDYGICWALMEGSWKPTILSWGPPTPLSVLKHVTYWRVFEYEPRLTRPLSALFEIYDTPFRAALWHLIPPHPSLSLTWIFSFVLAPLLLFALLRQMKVSRYIAAIIVALYAANPGILSLEAFLFRPGKALANAGILLCLLLAARQSAKIADKATTTDLQEKRFGWLCLVMYCILFTDETALIAYPAVVVLFPRLVIFSRKTIAAFLFIPVAYAASIEILFPVLIHAAGTPLPPTGYEPAHSFIDLLIFRLPPSAYWITLQNLAANSWLILADSFGLIDPRLPNSPIYTAAFVTIAILGAVFLARAFLLIVRNLGNSRLTIGALALDDSALLIRAVLMLVLALLYEGVLMTVSIGAIELRAWGLYYYGTFCVIFLLIAAALMCEFAAPSRVLLAVFASAVVFATTFIFQATNQTYKAFHYYPHRPEQLDAMFRNKINRFDTPASSSALLYQKTVALWRARTSKAPVDNVPVELTYAVYELGLAPQPTHCEFETLYFDLVWNDGTPKIICHN